MNTRNIQFRHSARSELCEEIIDRVYYRLPAEQLSALRQYVVTGDIDHFLKHGGDSVDPLTVFYMGSGFNLETAKTRLGKFMQDCTENPERYKKVVHFDPNKADWKSKCLTKLEEHLFGFYGAMLDQQSFDSVFRWLLGESFGESVKLKLILGNYEESFELSLDADTTAVSLMLIFGEYLFDMEDVHLFEASRIKNNYTYFMSVFPRISPDIFSTYLYPRKHELPNGKKSGYQPRQANLRRFIGYINGIPCTYDLDEGYEAVQVYDQAEYDRFMQMFNKIEKPKGYEELVEFIKETAPRYHKASEGTDPTRDGEE